TFVDKKRSAASEPKEVCPVIIRDGHDAIPTGQPRDGEQCRCRGPRTAAVGQRPARAFVAARRLLGRLPAELDRFAGVDCAAYRKLAPRPGTLGHTGRGG